MTKTAKQLTQIVFMALLLAGACVAQSDNAPPAPLTPGAPAMAPVAPVPPPAPVRSLQPMVMHFYKLVFTLKELQDGKTENERSYIMNVGTQPEKPWESADWWSLRAGSRIPVTTVNTGLNYIDVGVNLDIRAQDAPDAVDLIVKTELSAPAETNSSGAAPALRDVKVRSAVRAPLNKTTVVFTSDSISKRQFELDVTPTRQK